jgi:hypothetical protein
MPKSKLKINVFGLQSIGYQIEEGSKVSTDNYEIHFNELNSTASLDSYDGLIIPSGIFEKIKDESTWEGTYYEVYCKRDMLLQRERELINLLKKDSWVCCLVGKIIDEVPYDYETKRCADTDLTKNLLNSFDIKRGSFKGSAAVTSKNDEFNNYIKRWGIAKTILKLPHREQDRKILANLGNSVVGIEYLGKIFFLPFQTTDYSSDNALSLTKELCRAIVEYRQKRISKIPEWVHEFQFKIEEKLRVKLDSLLKEADGVQKSLLELQSYKSILSQSGDSLKDNIVLILRTFFKLNVTDVEDFKEDAVVRSPDGEPLVIIEIKGTKGGIRRKYINQIDTNRERIGVAVSTPGLLIINDQMNIENISQRNETSVADEQIKYAKNLNILIIRTLDFLFLIRSLENDGDPGNKLISLCNQGGGRLGVNDSQITIVT